MTAHRKANVKRRRKIPNITPELPSATGFLKSSARCPQAVGNFLAHAGVFSWTSAALPATKRFWSTRFPCRRNFRPAWHKLLDRDARPRWPKSQIVNGVTLFESHGLRTGDRAFNTKFLVVWLDAGAFFVNETTLTIRNERRDPAGRTLPGARQLRIAVQHWPAAARDDCTCNEPGKTTAQSHEQESCTRHRSAGIRRSRLRDTRNAGRDPDGARRCPRGRM